MATNKPIHRFYTKEEDQICYAYPSSKKYLPKGILLVKLRGSSSFEFSPESEGKTRYMIATQTTDGKFKNLGILKQYEAVIQLQELFKAYPKILSRKAFKPSKAGTMSSAFMEEIGTNAISDRFEEVPTLQECKAFMNARFKGYVQDYMS